MANNNGLFNAALSGAYAGINTSRSLTSAVAADYAAQQASALAFATLLDAAIAPGSFSSAEEALLLGLVQEIISGKGEASPNSALIAAIIAAFDEARTSLEPVTPETAFTNLSSVWYCDAATAVATPDQTGNIETPFATIAQAVAAAASQDTVVCVGDFIEDLSIDKFLTLSSIAEGVRFTVTGTHQTTDAITVKLSGATIAGTFDLFAGSVLEPKDCTFDTLTGDNGAIDATDCVLGDTTLGNIALAQCRVNGAPTVIGGGTQAWSDCVVLGAAIVGDFTGTNCQFVSDLTGGGGATLTHCSINGAISSFNELTLNDVNVTGTTDAAVIHETVNCTFADTVTAAKIEFSRDSVYAAVALTGANNNVFLDSKYAAMSGPGGSTVDMDAYSASWAAVTGGLVRSIVAPRATLTVNVPVLAANAIGTATQVCTGSILAGITTNSQVVANEPTAGVTGGGFLASARVSATNTILFTFHGPTTGGNQSFIVTQI